MTSSVAVYPEAEQIGKLIADAEQIVIMQADNPDADSLGSALALEQILGDMGKQPYLYCGVQIPEYLRYLDGWDRVERELPTKFDLSIIVDTSADSLFGVLAASSGRQLVASKPCIIIDHHDVQPSIPYATVVCNPVAVATGEVIYELGRQLDWPVNAVGRNMLMTAIMGDSLGLSSEATSARSIYIVAKLVEQGVVIAELEQKRRALMRKSPEILAYKGQLLQRIEYVDDGRIAIITIPWEEIQRYSHAYNPSMLVLDDMRSASGVQVAIAFKLYNDGKITAKIRCNYGSGIGGELAGQFGGGGHAYASGFKLEDDRLFADVKQQCIAAAAQLLDQLKASQL